MLEPNSLIIGLVAGIVVGILIKRESPVKVIVDQPSSHDVHHHYYPEPTIRFEEMDDGPDLDEDEDDDDGDGGDYPKFPSDWSKVRDR